MKCDFKDLHPFVVGYVTAMFWTQQPDEDCKPGEFTKNYSCSEGWDTFTEEEQARIVKTCSSFAHKMEPFLKDYPLEKAGQDFWLSRSGSGSGFLDENHGSSRDCEALDAESDRWGEAFVVFEEGKWWYEADRE